MATDPTRQRIMNRYILEDVLNTYILNRLDNLRKDKEKILFEKPDAGPASAEMAEMHCELCMEYFASLDCVVPVLKVHQEVLVTLAKRYAVLGEKPKSRTVKDWAAREAASLRCMVMHALNLCRRAATSRSRKVFFLKQFLAQHLANSGLGGDPDDNIRAALEAAASTEDGSVVSTPSSSGGSPAEPKHEPRRRLRACRKVSPDELETLEMEVELDRIVDGQGLPDAADAIHADGERRQAEKDRKPLECERPLISKEMEATAAATLAATVPETEAGDPYEAQLAKRRASKVESAEALVHRASADPKVKKQLKVKGKRGKGKVAKQQPNTDCPEPAIPESGKPEMPDEKSDDEKSDDKKPDDKQCDDKKPDTKTLWIQKEDELRTVGVQIPEGFEGKTKSFSLKPPENPRLEDPSTLGILWSIDQIYVTKVLDASAVPQGLQPNKKNGCTISIKKRGGWQVSYKLAQQIAGWI